jgi:hypothetical protein
MHFLYSVVGVDNFVPATKESGVKHNNLKAVRCDKPNFEYLSTEKNFSVVYVICNTMI